MLAPRFWFSSPPATPGTLADLQTDPAPLLRALPVVAQVEVSPAQQPASGKPVGRILHLRDLHLSPPDGIPEAAYARHLLQVELCQAEQLALLRAQVARHGLRAVWVEGMTDRGREAFLAKIEPFRGQPAKLPTPPELLNAGAAPRLWLAGELSELLPLEDAVAYQAAGVDGRQDREGNRRREEAMVKRIVAQGSPLAVVVLGAAHDLRAVAAQIAPGWEVVRVTTKAVKEVMGE